MQATELMAFLSGNISGSELQSQIAEEVDAWSEKLSERGRSASIALLGVTGSFEITKQCATRLLDALIKSELSPFSFDYVLNALLLSENFHWKSDAIRDLLEDLSNPEWGGTIDLDRAWKVRASLTAMRSG